MLIERKALKPRRDFKIVKDNCIGCPDCEGVCAEYLHLIQYPEVMAGIREART